MYIHWSDEEGMNKLRMEESRDAVLEETETMEWMRWKCGRVEGMQWKQYFFNEPINRLKV